MGRTAVDYEKLDKLLKQQAKDRANRNPTKSDSQISRDVPCSRNTVINRKKDLRAQAALLESQKIAANAHPKHDKKRGPRTQISAWTDVLARADDPESFIQFLDDQPILTPLQSMKLMSMISNDPRMPPAVRTQADARLQALREKHAPPDTLGPGAPLTTPEKRSRLVCLFEACGEKLSLSAWKETSWNLPPEPVCAEENSSPGPTQPGPPAESAGTPPATTTVSDGGSPPESPSEDEHEEDQTS